MHPTPANLEDQQYGSMEKVNPHPRIPKKGSTKECSNYWTIGTDFAMLARSCLNGGSEVRLGTGTKTARCPNWV